MARSEQAFVEWDEDDYDGHFRIPDAVMYHPELSATAKLLYAVFARYATFYSGKVFPSAATLTTHLNCKATAVRDAMRLLETHKLIERERQDGKPSRIVVKKPKGGLQWSSSGPIARISGQSGTDPIGNPTPYPVGNPLPPCRKSDTNGKGKETKEKERKEELDAPRQNESLLLVEALCKAGDFDINALIDSERGRWFGTAKRLVERDGISAADVTAFVAYRKTTFRTDMPTMFVVAKEIGAWIAAGRPTHAVQKNGHTGRVPWSEIGKQVEERRRGENPFDPSDDTIEVEVRNVR